EHLEARLPVILPFGDDLAAADVGPGIGARAREQGREAEARAARIDVDPRHRSGALGKESHAKLALDLPPVPAERDRDQVLIAGDEGDRDLDPGSVALGIVEDLGVA